MTKTRGLLPAFLLVVAAAQAQQPRPRPFTPNDALDVATWQVADLTGDGHWVALTGSTRRAGLGVDYRRDGDPTYIRPASVTLRIANTTTGESRDVFAEGRNLRSPVWSPDGSQLAFLLLQDAAYVPVVWERVSGKSRTYATPTTHYVAENSDLRWSGDGTRLVVALRSNDWKKRVTTRFEQMTKGPVFVQDSKEPFLAWDDLRRQGNVRSIAAIDVTTGKVTELLPESMIATYSLSKNDSLLTWQQDITKVTDYDVIAGAENKLMARAVSAATPVEVLSTLKNTTIVWAPDGRRFAYGREGRVYVGAVGEAPRQIIGADSAAKEGSDTSAAARTLRANERYTPQRWSPTGDALLVSNRQGLWLTNLSGGDRAMILETNDSSLTAPRYATAAWSEDGRYLYFTRAARTQWERGIVRYDRTARRMDELVKDGRFYSALRLAKSGDVAVLSIGEGNRPADVFATDAALSAPRRIVATNPQLNALALATTSLLSYHDIDGKTRYGVVHYPVDYVPGKAYPTLFNVYEDFFDDTFDATINVLTSNGYVVVKPSVGFEVGFPGEAWLKGVTAAANKLVEMGIADSSKLGVFGTSYGGYATNLLITQTNRFKAAVNTSGKVDIISFYTDSPRLGVRNTHAAEKSQDRIGATLWQQPQKYVEHSAVMFADRITTPLMLMTGQQDSNVPADNTREMYYALRRLGKDVVWVDYMNSGHGTPGTNAAEFIDWHQRMLWFFGKHLKGESGERAVEGVSLFGDSLYRPTPTGATRQRMEQQLTEARAAVDRAPTDVDAFIWLGRRLAYPGRFNDAIRVYTEAMARFPNDARLYRHRGHRYITLRRFDDAIRDLERAALLTKGKPDEVEPDGQPNARNIPTSTLQSNIWYHLALAYYLKGDFVNSQRAWREDLKVAKNADMQVATSHWLYMTLRRMGQVAEAAKVLEPIRRDMDVIENGSYHRLLLMYKGEIPVDSLLPKTATANLEDVTLGFGVGNWNLYNGKRAEAEATFRRVLSAQGQWAAFGYIASEAELRRMTPSGTVSPDRTP